MKLHSNRQLSKDGKQMTQSYHCQEKTNMYKGTYHVLTYHGVSLSYQHGKI